MGKNRWKTGVVVDVVPKKYYVLNNSFDVQVQIEGKLIWRECEKVKLVEKWWLELELWTRYWSSLDQFRSFVKRFRTCF